jgi:hypothetical protein
MQVEELAAYLYKHRGEAKAVPFAEYQLADWRPTPNDCHRNVDHWVAQNPGYRAVRGWLVFDFRINGPLLGMRPHFRFNAHSTVRSPDGTIVDITPSYASQRYPFMPHPFDEQSFVALVNEKKIVLLEHFLN